MILQHLTLLQSLTLSHDLIWIDEHAWSPAVANLEYSLTGALLMEYGTRQAGRPITLQPPDASMAWHTRNVIDKVLAWSRTPGQKYRLTLDDGRNFTILFRHHESPVMEAKPVTGLASYSENDYWQITTLKFMEV